MRPIFLDLKYVFPRLRESAEFGTVAVLMPMFQRLALLSVFAIGCACAQVPIPS
jgi:hypothetical protein